MVSERTETKSDSHALRVGLTGGIASGKTAVSRIFEELGVPVIDTDVIAREVVMPGQPALDQIAEHFGASIIDENGELNRSSLRDIVFSGKEQRDALEAILHPRIRERTLDLASHTEAPYLIIVVPLLFETDFHTLVDRTLVVHTSPERQKARLIERDAASEALAEQIIGSQLGTDERLTRADDTVENSGSLAQLREQIVALHEKYLQQAP